MLDLGCLATILCGTSCGISRYEFTIIIYLTICYVKLMAERVGFEPTLIPASSRRYRAVVPNSCLPVNNPRPKVPLPPMANQQTFFWLRALMVLPIQNGTRTTLTNQYLAFWSFFNK